MQAGGVGAPPAHFLQRRAREAGAVGLEGKQQSARRARPARAHGNGVVVGAHAGGDEGFFAADHEFVFISQGLGAQVCDIGAAARLGDRQRAYFLARQDRRQHAALQLLAALGGDRRRADGVRKQARRNAAAAGVREFLRADDAKEVIGGRAAVFFREAEAEQPGRRGLAVELAREFARFVPFSRVRQDLALDKAAHRVAPGLVLLGEGRMGFHTGSNSTSSWAGRTWAPASTWVFFILEEKSRLSPCSIFIASSTTSGVPASTFSPVLALTATTRPFMGASSRPSLALLPLRCGGS